MVKLTKSLLEKLYKEGYCIPTKDIPKNKLEKLIKNDILIPIKYSPAKDLEGFKYKGKLVQFPESAVNYFLNLEYSRNLTNYIHTSIDKQVEANVNYLIDAVCKKEQIVCMDNNSRIEYYKKLLLDYSNVLDCLDITVDPHDSVKFWFTEYISANSIIEFIEEKHISGLRNIDIIKETIEVLTKIGIIEKLKEQITNLNKEQDNISTDSVKEKLELIKIFEKHHPISLKEFVKSKEYMFSKIYDKIEFWEILIKLDNINSDESDYKKTKFNELIKRKSIQLLKENLREMTDLKIKLKYLIDLEKMIKCNELIGEPHLFFLDYAKSVKSIYEEILSEFVKPELEAKTKLYKLEQFESINPEKGSSDIKGENPHPRIFINNNAFKLFEHLKESIKNKHADYSFIFRAMHRDEYIHSGIKESEFRDWLEKIYGIVLIKLKLYDYCSTVGKENNYKTAKQLYKL